MNNRNDEHADRDKAALPGDSPDTTNSGGAPRNQPGASSPPAASGSGATGNAKRPWQRPGLQRKRANFATMSNLMTKLVVKLGLDQRLKEHALMYLWPSLVGDMFATNSRCLFIDNERKLVVSVQDASVGQELSLMRREILRKMQVAANNLGVKIEGIRFDMKHFHKAESEIDQASTFVSELPQATQEDLQSVTLSEEELAEIEALKAGPANPESVQGANFTSKLHLGERIATIFEHELRLKKWRAVNGYPLCAECAGPSIQLHGDNRLCAHCFYKSISPKSI